MISEETIKKTLIHLLHLIMLQDEQITDLKESIDKTTNYQAEINKTNVIMHKGTAEEIENIKELISKLLK